jgi:peptidase E
MPIVAMSSGTLSDTPEGSRFNAYLRSLVDAERPRICYIPTAVGDAAESIVSFYRTFHARAYEPSHLGLFNRQVEDARSFLLGQDIIFVNGGNTASMLAVWRRQGIDAVLHEAWAAGIVLCGFSAGALCWFESGTTDSFGPRLAGMSDCLGFLRGSFSPHYDSEGQRRPVYRRCVAEGMAAGWALEDGTALHYEGTELRHVYSARDGAHVYRVELIDGEVQEREIDTEPLP